MIQSFLIIIIFRYFLVEVWPLDILWRERTESCMLPNHQIPLLQKLVKKPKKITFVGTPHAMVSYCCLCLTTVSHPIWLKTTFPLDPLNKWWFKFSAFGIWKLATNSAMLPLRPSIFYISYFLFLGTQLGCMSRHKFHQCFLPMNDWACIPPSICLVSTFPL
jgi:hypothetical protein